MAGQTVFKLNTGAGIPAVGFGTWQAAPGETAASVTHAIKSGYRHIDAAYIYGNENEVGQGIKDGLAATGLKRSDIFVTTKLWCTWHSRVEEALATSLKNLDLEYVDLYLMHWPVPMNPNGNHPNIPKLPDGSRDLDTKWSYVETWKELEKVAASGKTKAIGVANFSVPYLEKLLESATIVPAANQIENHPLLPQQEIVDFCKSKGIHITAYSPLGSTGSPLLKAPIIVEVAQKKGISPGAVLLSYHIARGSSVLPKSVTPSRIEENIKSLVYLDDEDMAALIKYTKENPVTRFVYPEFGVNLGFPDKQ